MGCRLSLPRMPAVADSETFASRKTPAPAPRHCSAQSPARASAELLAVSSWPALARASAPELSPAGAIAPPPASDGYIPARAPPCSAGKGQPSHSESLSRRFGKSEPGSRRIPCVTNKLLNRFPVQPLGKAWFDSIADKQVDQGGFAGGREISKSGTRDLPWSRESITGFEAENLDAAEKAARSNPFVASIRIYELR